MARKPRVEFAGALYHVIVRGNHRRDIFRDRTDRVTYLERVEHYRERYRCVVYAYVLMSNHVHLLIETGSVGLSKIMQGIQFSYTQRYNRRYRAAGHLFQGRYKAILCDRDAYLLELVRYIHLNPARMKHPEDPWRYRWSSHRVYLGEDGPVKVETTAVLKQFASTKAAARRGYLSFMRDGLDQGHLDRLYARKVQGHAKFRVRSCNDTSHWIKKAAMARPLRLEFPGAIYHLTSRGNARQKVFFTDADRELFLRTLAGVVGRYEWICHAYCLMKNHYHLLVETPKANLSIGMRQLNGIYTQSFNRRHKRVGHLFQGRFKAILVEKESHLLELCRYIVLNPLRVKGSGHPQTWKWSSYRATAGLASAPPLLSTDWILEQFGKKRSKAQQRYREFVREGLASRPWEELKGQVYLGTEAFVEKHATRKQHLKEIPRAQLTAAKPSLERLFAKSGEKAIAAAYGHGYRLNEIAAHLGVHYATVSRRLKQLEESS